MQLTSDITVNLIQHVGGDHMIVAAAKVSTCGDEVLKFAHQHTENYGLIRYLMQHRHGSPFEHGLMTFFVHAPIFVWREWHRHRIGFSYNEESGRYKQLDPVFYVPPRNRPMFKADKWKPGRPKFLQIDDPNAPFWNIGLDTSKPADEVRREWADSTYANIRRNLTDSYKMSYAMYESNLRLGIDPGLARDCLPVGIYSSCWVTCNPRSLMAFLSLRTHEPDAKAVSYPLHEIGVAARKCEALFAEHWPLTHKAFNECGRVGP